jgi:hypothetical protein
MSRELITIWENIEVNKKCWYENVKKREQQED